MTSRLPGRRHFVSVHLPPLCLPTWTLFCIRFEVLGPRGRTLFKVPTGSIVLCTSRYRTTPRVPAARMQVQVDARHWRSAWAIVVGPHACWSRRVFSSGLSRSWMGPWC